MVGQYFRGGNCNCFNKYSFGNIINPIVQRPICLPGNHHCQNKCSSPNIYIFMNQVVKNIDDDNHLHRQDPYIHHYKNNQYKYNDTISYDGSIGKYNNISVDTENTVFENIPILHKNRSTKYKPENLCSSCNNFNPSMKIIDSENICSSCIKEYNKHKSIDLYNDKHKLCSSCKKNMINSSDKHNSVSSCSSCKKTIVNSSDKHNSVSSFNKSMINSSDKHRYSNQSTTINNKNHEYFIKSNETS